MTLRNAVQKFKIIYYFDVVSPYACCSFFVLKRYMSHWNLDLVLKPVFLGGIMKLAENQPPAMHPLRAAYLEKDYLRNKQYFNLPEMCDEIPNNLFSAVARKSLQVQRFLCYAFDKIDNEGDDDPRKNAIQNKLALLQSFFEGVHCDKEGRLQNENQVLIDDAWIMKKAKRSGVMDENFLLQALSASKNDQLVKKQLQANTTEIVHAGGFGLPIMMVGEREEFYFGSDRFEQLACNFKLPWYGPDPNKSKL